MGVSVRVAEMALDVYIRTGCVILDKNHIIHITKCLTIFVGIQYTDKTGEQ